MAVTAYSPGDLVAQQHRFSPCGHVVDAQDGMCQVLFGNHSLSLPEDELILISVKNIPNLRLIEQKITEAESNLADQTKLGHSIMGYLGGGSVVSRAFADYLLKVPLDILMQCLRSLSSLGKDIPEGIDDVLNLNFRLISGAPSRPK